MQRWAWDEAHAALAAVDRRDAGALSAEDLERLARSAYLTGHDAEADDAWVRAHTTFLSHGEALPAARCAFWLGMVLVAARGAEARGRGWLSRAGRLVEERGSQDSVERGYLMLPAALAALDGHDPQAAHDLFAEAVGIGRRHRETDLVALARLGQGQALLRLGEADRGLGLLDEVMVAVDARQVSPIPAGISYCAVILACRQVADLHRAQQWTEALARWCALQPGLVPFRGTCLVHRSELAQLRGDWTEAAVDAASACDRLSDHPDPAAGMAFYQRAELHRLRGEHADAEAAYEHAAARGHDPHPGLALLWMAQGRLRTAAAAMRRVVGDRTGPHPPVAAEVQHSRSRAEALAAAVEVMLAADDRETASTACAQLDDLAESLGTPIVDALAAAARGAVLLAEDQPRPALDALTEARSCWLSLDVPYEAARVRVQVARALQALGDADTAAIELQAARQVFQELGAAPALERLDETRPAAPGGTAALTDREVDVVRLVAAGHTNREIASLLVVSDKTVARHLHNVFTKLDLPNRAAATAYAYEHGIV